MRRRKEAEKQRQHQEEQERGQHVEQERRRQEQRHKEAMIRNGNNRMKKCVPTKLNHQTSKAGADGIRQANRMNRGSTRYAGRGIYFAQTRNDTRSKATSAGYVIACYVKLGNIKKIGGPDSTITYHSLLMDGRI